MLGLLVLAISLAPGSPRWSLAWERRAVFASGLAGALPRRVAPVGATHDPALGGRSRVAREGELDPLGHLGRRGHVPRAQHRRRDVPELRRVRAPRRPLPRRDAPALVADAPAR